MERRRHAPSCSKRFYQISSSFKRAKRPPVTLDALCVLHGCLNLGDAFNAPVWALASLAFWSCCCLVLPFVISLLENADISITARDHRTCPLTATLNHCAGSKGLPNQIALAAFRITFGFCRISRHARSCFSHRRSYGAAFTGRPPPSPDVVATQGRWKSFSGLLASNQQYFTSFHFLFCRFY